MDAKVVLAVSIAAAFAIAGCAGSARTRGEPAESPAAVRKTEPPLYHPIPQGAYNGATTGSVSADSTETSPPVTESATEVLPAPSVVPAQPDSSGSSTNGSDNAGSQSDQ